MATQVGEAVIKLTFNANTGDLKAELNKTESTINKSSKSMSDSQTKAFNSVAKGAAVAGAALGVFTKGAVDVGINFDSAMSKVQAISGATGDDLDKLRNKAKEMGRTTKFTATESAEALTYMAMAGWKTTDMLDGLEGIMNLAAASGEDLATTSDIVTDALTAFGYSASDSAHFADVLAKASSNANTNVSMMGESFKYVGPVAGSLGYSVEDVSLALGLMANSGIKASSAGTSLRQALVQITKPSKTAAARMDELGISLFDESGKAKSLRTVMDELRTTFGDLKVNQEKLSAAVEGGDKAFAEYAASLPTKESEKFNDLVKIFGARSMPAMMAIINASTDDYQKLSDAIEGADGAAGDMAKTMLNNTGGALTLLKSNFEGLQLEIAEKLSPAINGIIAGLNGVVNFLAANQWIFPMITAGISSILALALTTKLAGFITTLTSMNPVMAGVILAITAIAGLASFVIENWSGITQFFGDIWNNIVSGAQAAWNGITTIFGNVAGFFGSIFSAAWNAVKKVFSTGGKIFMGIVDGIVKAFKSIVNAIIGGINKVVAMPFNTINGILDGLRGIDILGIKPFGWLGRIDVPQIPRLAQGGYANGETTAVIGEAGKEVVIPLERNTDNWAGLLATTLAKQMEQEGTSDRPIVVNMTNQINNEMDAEDIGRVLMQSIRRAS